MDFKKISHFLEVLTIQGKGIIPVKEQGFFATRVWDRLRLGIVGE